MKPIHGVWLDGPTGPRAFNYVPSWQSNRPGYLAEKFRKIQKELRKQEQLARAKEGADRDN